MLPPPLAPDVSAALQLVITGLLLIYGAVLVVRHAASRYFVASFAEGYNHRHPMSFVGGGGGGGGGAARDGLCVVCGEEGNKKCSRCKTARYCSHACQSKHWEAGHKSKCKRTSLSDMVDTSSANGSSRRRRSSGFSSISLVPARGSCKVLKEPKKILFPYDEFVKLFNWDKPGFRPCGLMNCGNSCFANVILQCLASTRPLTAYLLEREHSRFCIRKQDDWCFLCELQVHIRRASESSHPFSPHNILSRLPNIGGNLGYGRQEDAHEFMRFAIDTMQSICLDEFGGEKALDPSSQETTLIQYTFGGHLRSQVTCMECNMVSNRYENMMDLTVEILGDAESLEDCLNQFTAKEFLDGENMYKCDGCNDYVKAWKRLTVHQAPNILTIALKRFQSGRFGKLNKRVTFPEVLDLTPYMSGNGDGTDLYTLYAVVVHLDMLNASFFGHYICYTKDSHGQWYRIDDCKVMNVEVEEVLAQGAYMLLYGRKNARQEPLIKPMEPESKRHSSKSEHVSSSVTDAANHSSVPACLTDDVASQLNVYSHEKSVDVSSLRDTSHERESSIDASHERELSIIIDATKRAEPESVALDAPKLSVVIDAMKGTEPESMDLDEPLEENSMPVCKGLGDMHVDGKLLAMQEGKDLRVENPGFSSCALEDAVAVDPIYSSSIAQGNVSTTQFPAVESKLSDATQSSDCCLQEYRQSMNIREKAASDDFSGNGCVINSSQVEEPLVDSKPDLEHPGALHSPLNSANGAVRQSSLSSMNGTNESKALELSWVESRQRKSKPLFACGFLDTTAKKKLVAPGARTQIGNHVGITPEAYDCSNGHLKLAFVQNGANNISGCGKDSPIYDASFLSSGSVNESCGNSFNEVKVVREESDRMGHSHCNGCAEWASSCQNDSKDDRVKMCCLNGKTSPSEDYERPLLSSHSLDNIPAVESNECYEDLGGTNIKNNNKGAYLGNGYDKSSYGCLGDGLKSVDVLHPTKLGSPGRFNKLIASDVRSNSIDYEGPLLSSHSLDNMSSKKRVLSQEELGSTDMEGHNK